MQNTKKAGSITVYLTLVIIIILSLITTCIEAARFSAAKYYGKSVLNTALKSTFGEYYLPLYEKYHVFGLDAGFGAPEYNEQELIRNVSEVMQENLTPEISDNLLSLNTYNNFLITNLSLENLSVTKRQSIIDNNGESFKEQAIHYQKYSAAAKLIKEILEKLGALTSIDEANEILNEKLNVETTLYKIDTKLLNLIQYIDGFAVDDKGLKTNMNGKPLVKDSFAKKITNFTISQSSAQINNLELFNTIKNCYDNPILKIDDLLIKGEEAKIKKTEWEASLDELNRFLDDYDPLDVKQVILLASLNNKVDKSYQQYVNSMKDVNKSQRKILLLLENTQNSINQAITCIDEIAGIRDSARSSVENYINIIKEKKEVLEESFYNELMSGTELMSEYTNTSNANISIIYNIDQMKETLTKNSEILYNSIKLLQVPFSDSNQMSWNPSISSVKSNLSRYSHEGLALNYSNINLRKEDNKALGFFKDLVEDGFISLVVEDVESLSSGRLPDGNLVSSDIDLGREKNSENLEHFVERNLLEKDNQEDQISFEQLALPIGDLLLEEANSLMESMLYISYIEEHFSNYLSSDKEALAEQVLTYEQEYILFGDTLDKDNIKAMVSRIILIRTLINLVHVLTDSTKANTASAYAATLVGFTGLPFLISIVKYITLFVWAFEEALVETAALLLGKEVSLITTKNTFVLEFSDIFSISKNFIMNKAKSYQGKSGLKLTYQNYIRVFLLLQNKTNQYYRSMDLVQENIRYVYEDSFLLSKCLTEFEVSADYYMPQMFFKLPIFIKSKQKSMQGYKYNIKAAVSY